MEPKLTIIIPVLNESKYIDNLLSRLLQSSDIRFIQIIVVDGGSQDDTVVLAKKYPIEIYTCPQQSRASQMNYGAKYAKANILYFVHADTLPPLSFYQDILTAIEQGNNFGFFRQKFDSKKLALLINSFFTRFNFLLNRGGDQSMYISKELFEKLNGFDEKYVIMEEYNLMDRAEEVSSRFVIPKYTIVSDRKYDHCSWIKVQLANFHAMRMYKQACDPRLIKSEYIRRLGI